MRVRSCVRACVTALLVFGLRACSSLEDEDEIEPPGGAQAQLWVQGELKTPNGREEQRVQEKLKTSNGRVELRVQEELKSPDGGEELRVQVQVSGRALVPGVRAQDWISSARVLLDGERHVGFLRDDGSFTVSGVPSGSYVLEVSSPTYRFQPVRVDVSSAGKMRARVLNYIQTSEVILLPYPLQMRSAGLHSFFMARESWGWADFILNPMVLMMVLPLLVILLLPRVFNPSDPEMRREIEQSMNMLNSNQELPDVSEIMTKIFSPAKGQGRAGGGARSQRGGAQGQRGGAPRRR